jgi:hypothetical protein
VCARLIGHLHSLGADVYLHVDEKSAIEEFIDALGEDAERVIIVRDRLNIRWGGFLMVQATLDLLRRMRATKLYDRYTLLSGDSYPIKPTAEILQELEGDEDFISSLPVMPGEHKYQRLQFVHMPDSDIGSLRANAKARYFTAIDLDAVEVIPKLIRERGRFLERFPYFTGSQWWSLRKSSLDRVMDFLESEPDYLLNFRYSAVPDEAFFHTAYRHLGLQATKTRRTVVYVDWSSHPQPRLFKEAYEMERLFTSEKLFARKFCDDAIGLLDIIDRRNEGS